MAANKLFDRVYITKHEVFTRLSDGLSMAKTLRSMENHGRIPLTLGGTVRYVHARETTVGPGLDALLRRSARKTRDACV